MFNGNYTSCPRKNTLRPARAASKSKGVSALIKSGRRVGQALATQSANLFKFGLADSRRGAALPANPKPAVANRFTEVREAASILSLYMREAGEIPLLTPPEEIVLAARIKRGDAAAREHMIRANLRFVIKIAREYENLGMPLLDLINEGNIGLMKAVERFDPTKGGKLTTYAALWIKQQIRRALASQGKTIRLPVHVADKIYHLTQAEVRLRHELGREATDEELALELGIKLTRIAKLRRAAARPS